MNPTQFAADLSAALPELRAFAEARMTSRANVRRLTARTPYSSDKIAETESWAIVYAALPFRLHVGSQQRTERVADVERTVSVRTGSFPALIDGAPLDLADGDLVEILSGDNAGRVYAIRESDWADQSTARRVDLVAADRPTGEGWDE